MMIGIREVLAQYELARLFLRIEGRRMPIIGRNSGGYIGKFWPPVDSAGQKIPGLHLSVACNLRSERAIGT